MKYLITGITGFVAPHLAKLLLNNGHEVYGSYRTPDKLNKISNILEEDYNKIKFVKCDFLNPQDIDQLFENNYDGIFNLAAITSIPQSFTNPVECFNINAMGTISLCNAIQKYKPECNLLHCSTGEVYGIQQENVLIDETLQLNPINPYGVAKAASDLYILERTKNKKLNGVIVRPFSHSGPGRPQHFSISSDAIQIARIALKKQNPIIKVGNIFARRTLLDVRDVVDVYYKLMKKLELIKTINGEVYNVGGNTLYEIKDYINIMCKEFNLTDIHLQPDPKLYRPIDTPVQNPNSTKIKKLLNWEPQINITNTLRDIVNYWIKYEYMEKI